VGLCVHTCDNNGGAKLEKTGKPPRLCQLCQKNNLVDSNAFP